MQKQPEIKYRAKTQGEIKSIDRNKIREESLKMLDDTCESTESELETKYTYLYTMLPSLFKMIIRDKNDEKNEKERIDVKGIRKAFVFNKIEFKRNLEMLLSQFADIQDDKLKNEDEKTHKDICNKFTEKYIPSKFLQ